MNDKSKETLKVLREFTNKSYSILDVSSDSVIEKCSFIYTLDNASPQYRRMLDVLQSSSVALSGYQFFKITRGIILTVSGTKFIFLFVECKPIPTFLLRRSLRGQL